MSGYRPGFHVGVRANYYITNPNTADGLYANGALLLSLKGGKTVFDSKSYNLTSPCYLELPVHLFGELGPFRRWSQGARVSVYILLMSRLLQGSQHLHSHSMVAGGLEEMS
jgi:hypothetical protein